MDGKQTLLNDSSFVSTPSVYPTVDWNSLLSCPNEHYRPINQISESPYSIASTSHSVVAYDDINESMQSNRRIGRASASPRFEFRTRSETDKLDDGYRWRKYGQKSVKDSIYPRSYFRCTRHTCGVKKQVQRLAKDDTIVITTYEGTHNHPCEKLIETLTPLLNQMQFLSNFN